MKEKLRKSRNISKKTGISGIIICLVALVVLAIKFINPDLYNEVSKTLFGNENNSLNASASNTSIVNDNDVDVKVNVTNPESLKDVTIKTSKKITSEFVSNDQTSLKVYFFDVGQADSMLIQNNGENMLIDAGNNEDGETLVNNLKTLGVEKIDYLVGTHPHEDHIGGLDNVINEFDIGTIYMPNITTNTKTYEDVITEIENKNLQISEAKKGDTFFLGNANCEFMTDSILDKNNLNLSSIVTRITFGNTSFLFTGDAETENEETRTWPKTDVLKVGHHGSDTSSSEEFLKQVSPKTAIISVGKDNDYGHPSDETIKKLQNLGTTIYRTDELGTIELISDGNNIIKK